MLQFTGGGVCQQELQFLTDFSEFINALKIYYVINQKILENYFEKITDSFQFLKHIFQLFFINNIFFRVLKIFGY